MKKNVAGLTAGWGGTEVAPAPPPDTLALVSGFPELVVEGAQVTCSDPEASDCFPDRSDMRDRHPRTAMGITEDRRTFLLVVVDGRTDDSDGMYGAELADVLYQLGAWEAFNLDGGGSSQMWLDGDGYVNDYDGNNSGGGAREVANHWGVFAGSGTGMPRHPGHCAGADPCEVIPAAGGILDDGGACFQHFGDPAYWREEAKGYAGGLHWTNAWKSSTPDNWAWWRPYLAEAGEYLVEYYAEPGWAVYEKTRYRVSAAGVDEDIQVDQSEGNGWTELGTWSFAAGGDQYVAVYDHASSDPGDDQHVVSDAIRLTRVGTWCGDGTCADSEDCATCAADCPPTDEVPGNGRDDDCDGRVDEPAGTDPADTAGAPDTADPAADDSGPDGPGAGEAKGCGCGPAGTPAGWGMAPALLLVARRRRRARP